MDNEYLAEAIYTIVEFLAPKVPEHVKTDGRGVFFAKMDTFEIRYMPQATLDKEIPDPNALSAVLSETEKYDPETQICVLFFHKNEAVFKVIDYKTEAQMTESKPS